MKTVMVRGERRDEVRRRLYTVVEQLKGSGVTLEELELALLDLSFQIRLELLERKGVRLVQEE